MSDKKFKNPEIAAIADLCVEQGNKAGIDASQYMSNMDVYQLCGILSAIVNGRVGNDVLDIITPTFLEANNENLAGDIDAIVEIYKLVKSGYSIEDATEYIVDRINELNKAFGSVDE